MMTLNRAIETLRWRFGTGAGARVREVDIEAFNRILSFMEERQGTDLSHHELLLKLYTRVYVDAMNNSGLDYVDPMLQSFINKIVGGPLNLEMERAAFAFNIFDLERIQEHRDMKDADKIELIKSRDEWTAERVQEHFKMLVWGCLVRYQRKAK